MHVNGSFSSHTESVSFTCFSTMSVCSLINTNVSSSCCIQEEFDEFRALSYAHTDVFLLCFSVVNPTSFHNIAKKWVPDIRSHNPSSPIILVGTQSDLLLDVNVLINLDKSNVKPVLSSRARSMAEKVRAADYIECSSLTQKNLKEAFDAAIFAGIKNKARKNKKRRFSDRRTKAFSRCSWKKFFCFVWTDCEPCGLRTFFLFIPTISVLLPHIQPVVALRASLLHTWLVVLLDVGWFKSKTWAEAAVANNISREREDSGDLFHRQSQCFHYIQMLYCSRVTGNTVYI